MDPSWGPQDFGGPVRAHSSHMPLNGPGSSHLRGEAARCARIEEKVHIVPWQRTGTQLVYIGVKVLFLKKKVLNS